MHPIIFKLGPLTVYSYGVFVAAGFLTAGILLVKRADEYGIAKEKLLDLLFVILLTGLAGARLLHVLLNIDYFKTRPLEIFFIHRGGLAIHGAIIVAAASGIVFSLKNRMPVWKTGDLIMQYLPLGQSIGRIGCFLNGCCYGKVSRLGVIFPDAGIWHPTQAYESLGLLVIFIVLRLYSERKNREGDIFFLYLLLYSILRFAIDFLRADMPEVIFSLTASQIISAAIFVISLAAYWAKKRGILGD